VASREGQGTQGQNALAQATVSGSQGYYSFSGSERLQPQTQSAGIIIWSRGAPFLVTQFFVRKKCPLFLVPYMKVSAFFHLLAFFACWLGAVRATVNRLGRREKNRGESSRSEETSHRPDRTALAARIRQKCKGFVPPTLSNITCQISSIHDSGQKKPIEL